jgi:hypothetical protein
MSPRRLGIVAIAFFALMALPRPSNAGIAEVIWGMSGPQMIGFLSECRVTLSGTGSSAVQDCAIFPGKKLRQPARDRTNSETSVWLSLEGGYYVSTGKDQESGAFEFRDAHMLTFDPMLEIRSVGDSTRRVTVYHGVMGISYNFLWGRHFRRFANAAVKLRPLGVAIPLGERKSLDFAYNLRLYPNGFAAEEFGHDPLPTRTNTAEGVHGFTISFGF